MPHNINSVAVSRRNDVKSTESATCQPKILFALRGPSNRFSLEARVVQQWRPSPRREPQDKSKSMQISSRDATTIEEALPSLVQNRPCRFSKRPHNENARRHLTGESSMCYNAPAKQKSAGFFLPRWRRRTPRDSLGRFPGLSERVTRKFAPEL